MITVLFRVNGSADIGLGHVMRCLTLAEQLRQFSVKCVFLSSTSNLSQLFSEKGFDHHNLGLISNTEEKGIEQEDAEQCLHFISEYRVDIMVVDHYGLTEVWDKYVRPKVSNLVVIDDLVSTVHQCDFLINSHPQVKPEDYKKLVSIDTKLLLGHDFVLLRDEFLKKRDMAINKRESTTTISKILVSIGATDPNQFSLNVLSILNDIKFDGDVILLISSECQWIHSIKLDQNFSFVLDVRINTNSVSDLLVDVDLAIGSIGVSSWERCFLGLPSIVLVTADNQLNLASYLEIEGLAYLASMETIADKLYSIVNGK
jgi:UDP-2,4-diacetamido-2,4,6-trideoxy-beta-L-altropyranose hydrolase